MDCVSGKTIITSTMKIITTLVMMKISISSLTGVVLSGGFDELLKQGFFSRGCERHPLSIRGGVEGHVKQALSGRVVAIVLSIRGGVGFQGLV